jgi:hypothetical protein
MPIKFIFYIYFRSKDILTETCRLSPYIELFIGKRSWPLRPWCFKECTVSIPATNHWDHMGDLRKATKKCGGVRFIFPKQFSFHFGPQRSGLLDEVAQTLLPI